MIKEFQNNCSLYKCKEDYRFFKKVVDKEWE